MFLCAGKFFTIFGAVGGLLTVWSTFDFFFGSAVLCNLVVIFAMREQIVALVNDYEDRLKTGAWDATAADCVERLGLMKKEERFAEAGEEVKSM